MLALLRCVRVGRVITMTRECQLEISYPPSLKVTYNWYSECTFNSQTSKRFPCEVSTLLKRSCHGYCLHPIVWMRPTALWALHRATRKVKLYYVDADYRTMLQISDSDWVRMSEVRPVRSHMVRCTRIKKPHSGIFGSKQNFWFDWVLNKQNVRVVRQDFGWRVDKIDLLLPATLLPRSLSFVLF